MSSPGAEGPLRLVGVTLAATHPPRRGQQLRTAGILSHLGPRWVVDSYSLMIQRTDLPRPRRDHRATESWVDHRSFDPLLLGWIAGLGRLGLPPVYISRVGRLIPHRRLLAAVRTADIVMVESPYPVEWVRSMTPSATPLVLNAHNIEADLYPATRGWRHRASQEIGRCERDAFRTADLVLVPSPDDARDAERLGVHRVLVAPNGVNPPRQPTTDEDRRRARLELGLPLDGHIAVFTGARHPPNTEAVQTLERHAAEYGRAGVTVVVVGRCGLGRRPVANVRHVGEVADVAPYLAAADIGVVPLSSGSGTSFKTIEYLAAGIPVVTTEVGARGLELTPRRDAIVCRLDEMPGRVAEVLADDVLRARLQAAGPVAAGPFGWAHIGATTAAALEQLVAERSAAGRGGG